MVNYYTDNRGNSGANTCVKPDFLEGRHLLDKEPTHFGGVLVIHNN